jgi:3-methylfumaryl-CoA hydratase
VGDIAKRVSTIRSVSHKSGRSGDLVFVRVEHQIHTAERLALSEEHDIVYRQAPDRSKSDATAAAPAPAPAEWSRHVVPTEVLLFRYSALTFNGHRIHYDRRYVVEEEGYPGLVVHGPLIATLLLEAARGALGDRRLSRFEFRALQPLFDTAPFMLAGRSRADGTEFDLWAANDQGQLAMTASAVCADRGGA